MVKLWNFTNRFFQNFVEFYHFFRSKNNFTIFFVPKKTNLKFQDLHSRVCMWCKRRFCQRGCGRVTFRFAQLLQFVSMQALRGPAGVFECGGVCVV